MIVVCSSILHTTTTTERSSHMERRNKITQASVDNACEQLEKDGQNVTVSAVIAKIGGSFSTVGGMVKDWRKKQEDKTATVVEVPGTITKTMQEATKKIWNEASTQAHEKVRGIEELAQKTIQQAKGELQEYEVEIRRIEKELETKEQKIEQLNQKATEDQQKIAVLANQINGIESQLEKIEKEFKSLSSESIKSKQEIATLNVKNEHLNVQLKDKDKLAKELNNQIEQLTKDNRKLQNELINIVKKTGDNKKSK